MLRVFLGHCEGLIKADDGEKDNSDPFVVFKVILSFLKQVFYIKKMSSQY
jgi:hypothetical protein